MDTRRRLAVTFGTFTVLGSVVDRLFGSAYVVRMADGGLGFGEIGLVRAVGSLVYAVADFPSGVLADRYGRKRIAATGYLVLGVGLLGYGYGASFWVFVMAMSGWAAGVALISGAPTAWVVDELDRHHATDARTAVLSRVSSIALIGGAVAGLAAVPLMALDTRLVFAAAGALALTTALTYLVLGADNRGRDERTSSLSTVVCSSGRELLANPAMRLVLAKTGLRHLGLMVFLLSFPLHATHNAGIPASAIGAILALSIAAMAAGTWLVPTLHRRLELAVISQFGTAICALGFVVMAVSTAGWVWLAALVVFEVGVGLDIGAFGSWQHDVIPADRRSSWLSADTAIQTVVGIVGTLAAGFLIEAVGFGIVWSAAAAVIAASVVPVVPLRRLTSAAGVGT